MIGCQKANIVDQPTWFEGAIGENRPIPAGRGGERVSRKRSERDNVILAMEQGLSRYRWLSYRTRRYATDLSPKLSYASGNHYVRV